MADNKISLDELKKEMNQQVIEYLRESETSGNTPTEEQFRELGKRLVNNIGIEHRQQLSQDDLNILTNTMSNYFETEMVAKYKRSLREHPREVNGHWPKAVSEDAYKKYSRTLKEEKAALVKDIKYLLTESERTNRTPTEGQALSWLEGQMNDDLAGWGDEQGKRYVTSYVKKWLKEEYEKRLSLSKKKNPRRENGHWPWKTDEQEENEDSDRQTREGIIRTRKSGSTPIEEQRSRAPFASDYMKTYQSFSGYDMVCTIEMPMPKGGTYTQVIGELQTITYSIHQEKSPVRCLGDMNAKGYVFGPRTIAGTLIFTVFDRHWTTKMEKEYLANAGVNAHMLADEFPPFNLTISCANEYGHDAVCSIFGITLVNEGQVMSINDVFTENTYQFYATDVQYLAPVDVTMGGTKVTNSNLPQISAGTPVPAKPIPQAKSATLPKKTTPPPTQDPDKSKEKPVPKNRQSDSPLKTAEGLPVGMSDEEYKERMAKLDAEFEEAKQNYEKAAKENGYPPAWVRIMTQRSAKIYAQKKAAIDRAYKSAKGVLV